MKNCQFERLVETSARDIDGVRRVMARLIDSPVGLIPAVGDHIMAGRGKHLRPMLLIAAARLCGYEGVRHRFLAAGIEMIHSATLLHDDVIDESTLRRGKATAHQYWGEKASILVGDFFLARAFELMVRYGDKAILRLLSKTAARIAEGEALQLMVRGKLSITEEDYHTIITAKTACLFAAALKIGALVATASEAQAETLANYGDGLGIFYQRIDDLLDYAHQREGKQVGDDFAEGRITLPILYAYGDGSKTERRFLEECFGEGLRHRAHFLRLRELLFSKGILKKCFAQAVSDYQKAHAGAHAVFVHEEWWRRICGVAEFTHGHGLNVLELPQASLAA